MTPVTPAGSRDVTALDDGPHRAGVELQPPARGRGVPQPEQPRRAAVAGRVEDGSRPPVERLAGAGRGGQHGGDPSLVAMAAASTFVVMPPEPTWLPERVTSTPASSDIEVTSGMNSAPGRPGLPV